MSFEIVKANLDKVYGVCEEMYGRMDILILPFETDHKTSAEIAIGKLGLTKIPQKQITFTKVSPQDFSGVWWNREKQSAVFTETKMISHDMGFVFAFAYPLSQRVEQKHLSDEKLLKLVNEVSSMLFGNFIDDLEIVKWSQDWNFNPISNETGYAHYWTIRNRTKNAVIVAMI